MATKTIKQLNEEAKQKVLAVKTITDKGDEATEEELAQVPILTADAEKIVADLEKLSTTDSLKTINRIENSLAALNEVRRPGFAGDDGAGTKRNGQVAALKSAGELFLESQGFQNWFKSLAPDGMIPKVQFTSPTILIPGLKTLLRGASDAAGGAMVYNDQRPGIVVPYLFRPFRVRDVITILQTTSDAIEYARITSVTNAAAPVAEATSTSTGTKPESAWVTERATDTVKTIAHWIPATNRILSDAPQLRGMIDSFLRDGIEEELEDQIVAGDASGENFDGILHNTGVTSQAWSTNILTTTRKGRTKVLTTGRAIPNAYLMHPNDWETIDLLQDKEDRYFFGGPSVQGTPRLWGLPVIETEAMTEGYCTVGDHKQCVLWDREQTMISVSNSHENYFIKNLVAILAEMRAGFGILRPAAIVKCDLTA